MTTIQAIDDAMALEEGHFVSVPDVTGDIRTMWEPTDPDSVAIAKATFDDAKARGMTAYRVGKKGKQAGQTREFDPEAGALIFIKPLAGG